MKIYYLLAAAMIMALAKPTLAQSANARVSQPNRDQPAQQTGTQESLESSGINSGDTTWMLVSTALVMLMTPGLALFYGGMVRRKNVLGTIMQSFAALGIITVQWVLFGYSLALA